MLEHVHVRLPRHLHHRLDFGGFGDDAPDSDELAHFVGFDIANRGQLLRVRVLEVNFEPAQQLRRITIPDKSMNELFVKR